MTFTRTRDSRLIRSFLGDYLVEPADTDYVVGVEYGAIAKAFFLICGCRSRPMAATVLWFMDMDVIARAAEIAREFFDWVWANTSINLLITSTWDNDLNMFTEVRRPA